MAAIPINIAELVGRTPMVRLSRVAPEGVEVYAKLESFNPGGSVKDRIGVAMIAAAEAEGRIEPGRTTIVEATSGNTGIALAFVCAARGYDLVLTLPQGMSREREGLLRLYGAQVHVTESLGGMNEAVAAAQALARDPDVWLPDQFTNPANRRRTAAPPARRSGTRSTATSTTWSPGSAPAGRSPARARTSRSATRRCG
jgi:cysteine synthase A